MNVCKNGEMSPRLPITPLPMPVNRRFRFFRKEKKSYMSLTALAVEAIIFYLDAQKTRQPADDERLPV